MKTTTEKINNNNKKKKVKGYVGIVVVNLSIDRRGRS